MLRVYDEIRRPRAQKTCEESKRQGENYERRGRSGPTDDDIRKDLPGMWDFLWNQPMDEDVNQSIARLQQMGVFRL